MIIEASELKRDMQKNAGRQVAEGIDLSKSRESVDVWSATKALLYPILSPVLEDTEAVYGCTNCPTPLTYEFEDLIEYTPDDPM